MLKIDKNVPMPMKYAGGAPTKYPFRAMDVGDSTFVTGGKPSHFGGCFTKLSPKKFATRTVTEKGVVGVRIWRIE